MPSLKELDDDRIYHDGLELGRLREELANADKTIEHLTAAHKAMVARFDDERARRVRLVTALVWIRSMTVDPHVQLEIDKVLKHERS